MRTLQDVFNIVATHLMTQRKRSIAGSLLNEIGAASSADGLLGDSSPCYRGDNGLKCAIGILIPDEKYTIVMEGRSVLHEVVWVATGLDGNITNMGPLVVLLQQVHDCYETDVWKDRLRSTGKEFMLDVSILDTFNPITLD